MIFATVGTQLPFDRMIRAIDKWNKKQRLSGCFAQVGVKGFRPSSLDFSETLTPSQFANQIAKCKVIVSHAGMGTILTALQLGKPIIIMPRLASLNEHRNDHQLATVENLRGINGIYVAESEEELMQALHQAQSLDGGGRFSPHAQEALLNAVSDFVGGTIAGGSRYVH
ncbi:MAG: hypothetical protein JJ850_12530 [Kordiimonadaceae bacterium]|nr:hypothetical protein [Kordiimonadaceae bacterium]MBO6570761.1 hypothetical protein [Kordiimonadaceae bacterium]MBO6965442.1 hypothetical protein [Kordiimonadaceae bacterium]